MVLHGSLGGPAIDTSRHAGFTKPHLILTYASARCAPRPALCGAERPLRVTASTVPRVAHTPICGGVRHRVIECPRASARRGASRLRFQPPALSYRQHLPAGADFRLGPPCGPEPMGGGPLSKPLREDVPRSGIAHDLRTRRSPPRTACSETLCRVLETPHRTAVN